MITTFDTNVLIYAADRRDPRKQDQALELLRGSADAVLLWQVACEFLAAARKLAPQGLTREEAWDLLSHYRSQFRLVLPTALVLEHARRLHFDHQWSFWDALIVAACREAGVERIYSEDLPGAAPPGGPEIINPFA